MPQPGEGMRAREDMMLRDDRNLVAAYHGGAAPPMVATPFAPTLPPEAPEPSIIRGILRHFWLVVLFAVVGAGLAWVYLKNARPLYESTAKIYIEPSGPRAFADVLANTQRSNYLFTQA